MKNMPKLEGGVTPISSTDNSVSPAPKFGRSEKFLEDSTDVEQQITAKQRELELAKAQLAKILKGKRKMKESIKRYDLQSAWVNHAKTLSCEINSMGNGLYEAVHKDVRVGQWNANKDSGWIRKEISEMTAGSVASVPMPLGGTRRRGKGSIYAGINEAAVEGRTVKDIISMARQGMSDEDIAEQLGISLEQIQNILDYSIDDLEASDEYFANQEYQDVPAQEQPAQTPPVAESRKLKELSTNKLAKYKKAAGADATKADKEGDYKRGDKRFSGIVKATKKQFDNETKKSTNENFDRENDKLWGEGNWKSLNEKRNKVAEDDDPCWDGYKQIGMKKKGGKKVPNCVPKESVAEGNIEETEETAVINMFEKLVRQGRDPIDMIAHKFGWGSYELDQLAKNLGFKNSAEWARGAKQGKGVTEGSMLKSIKRGIQGWGGIEDKPKDLVKRNKGYDDETVKALSKTGKVAPHSPADLQKRVLDREMKKRGLGKEGVAEDWYDDKKAAEAALAKEFRKYKITARKWGGDDAYSWAVFINGSRVVDGLSSREVPYYKKQALQIAKKKQGVTEAQSMSKALANTLSKVEPGSKLDQKIKHHNDMVRRGGKGTMTTAPDGYHIDKKGMIRLGQGTNKEVTEDWYDDKKAAAAALAKEFRKYKITARKWGGDDAYSWAVFINGSRVVDGLSSREVPYYKKQALQIAKKKQGVAEGLKDTAKKVGKWLVKPIDVKPKDVSDEEWDAYITLTSGVNKKKNKKQGVAESKVDQLPTKDADYSDYSTEHLKTLLKPGILHRNEARFKALIRKELQKREQQSQQGVSEAALEEEQLIAKDLKKRLDLFKKGKDKELGDKPKDKEVQKKEQ